MPRTPQQKPIAPTELRRGEEALTLHAHAQSAVSARLRKKSREALKQKTWPREREREREIEREKRRANARRAFLGQVAHHGCKVLRDHVLPPVPRAPGAEVRPASSSSSSPKRVCVSLLLSRSLYLSFSSARSRGVFLSGISARRCVSRDWSEAVVPRWQSGMMTK